jgi:SAM-dependent methyltransferase
MTAPKCKACRTLLTPAHHIGSKNGYQLLRCPECKTVTVDPWPTVEELIRFYQAYEGTTDYKRKKDKKIARARRRIRKLIDMTSGRTFLDVGCNYGFTVKAALDLGLEAHGIDIDATAVSASRDMFGRDYYETISVQEYAAKGKKADIIYTSEVIEHVPDPESFMAAIATILNPGGVLFLTTPDAGHFRVPRDFVKWGDVMPPEHITYFTQKGLMSLCARNGLIVNKFGFSLKPGIRLTAVKK